MRKHNPTAELFNIMTTFKRYIEGKQTVGDGTGIVILVMGSPISGKSELAESLAQKYNAACINLDHFLQNLDSVQQEVCCSLHKLKFQLDSYRGRALSTF